MRLVTRLLEGNMASTSVNVITFKFKCTTPRSNAILTSGFSCVLKGAYDQLQCLVFIPTSVQTLLSGLYDSFEIFQSFQPRSNLTKKRSLETMVEYLVSNFFVSDSLKGKLLSLYTFLIEEPNLSMTVYGNLWWSRRTIVIDIVQRIKA